MLVKCDIDESDYENITHSVTLVPRLEYCVNLLNDTIHVLEAKRDDLKKSNQCLISDFDETSKIHLKALELEQITATSLEILSQIQKSTAKISNIWSVPEILSSSIPLIRIISAQLYDILPNCSQKLSKLSVHLGSIVLDCAVLTKARFDFSHSDEESSTLLDEVKLMVDSKLCKQYDISLDKIRF